MSKPIAELLAEIEAEPRASDVPRLIEALRVAMEYLPRFAHRKEAEDRIAAILSKPQ